MKERPILIPGPMVRAILEGRKTQTRRVVKFPAWADPEDLEIDAGTGIPNCLHPKSGCFADIPCPYGQPGDLLWCRETWASDGLGTVWYRADGETYNAGMPWKPSIYMPRKYSRINLEVAGVRVERLQDITEEDARAEGIYCENVIVGSNCNGGTHSEEFEDRYFWDGCRDEGFESAVDAYADLWDSINGDKYPWQSNPWVWAVGFKKLAGASR